MAWVDILRGHERRDVQQVADHDRNQDAPHRTHITKERHAREDERDDDPRAAEQPRELGRRGTGRGTSEVWEKLEGHGHGRHPAEKSGQDFDCQQNTKESAHGAQATTIGRCRVEQGRALDLRIDGVDCTDIERFLLLRPRLLARVGCSPNVSFFHVDVGRSRGIWFDASVGRD